MSLSNILLIPGMGQMSFRDALLDLAPYSPRAAYNFIDPANSLFQGTKLTTVTSATNPVGVVIDQTQGGLGSLGAELVTNGTFDSNVTGWTANNSAIITWISGAAQINVPSNSADRMSQQLTTVANRVYCLTVGSSTGDLTVRVGTTAIGSEILGSTPAPSGFKIVFRATSTTTFISFGRSVAGIATVDNISVREIPGNHATASSDAKRPLFARYPATGRRNLLIQTEGYSNAVWTKTTGTVPDNVTLTEPGGTRAEIVQVFAVVSGTSYTLSVVAKENPVSAKRYIALATSSVGFTNQSIAIFDLATGTKTFDNGNGSNYAITVEDDGYWRITNTDIATATTTSGFLIYTTNTPTGLTSAGGGSILLGGSQVETGSTATNYQKVVTSADITEAGVRDVYASLFDGADDCLQVSGFDMSNTDEVTVIAGVRKLSDAAGGTIAELSATISANNGAFQMLGPNGANPNYLFRSRGTTERVAISANSFSSPITNFLVGVGDISGDVCRLLINGTQVATDTADQGTGNYGNYTLNIGMRNNASLPFNGYIHYLFICGAIVPDSVLTKIYRGLGPRIGLTV